MSHKNKIKPFNSTTFFLQKLEYKCKLLIKVPARDTTIDCSRCGNAVPKSLAVRIHRCDMCGLVLDRDYNASINILNKGLNKLPQELGSNTCRDFKEICVVRSLL